MLKKTSRNLDTIFFGTSLEELLRAPLPTYISETVAGIFHTISSPIPLSIASGMNPLLVSL